MGDSCARRTEQLVELGQVAELRDHAHGGGVYGKGYGNGAQSHLDFIPEEGTDWADLTISELKASANDLEVAFRKGERWISGLTRIDLEIVVSIGCWEFEWLEGNVPS